MKFIIGKKLDMTQRFQTDGTAVAATRLAAGPIRVAQVKTVDRDGYAAVQIGLAGKKRQSKSLTGHLKDLGPICALKEFKVDDAGRFSKGQTFDVSVFIPGDRVDVIGISKGKGFSGVVKRHHFKGGPASHGHKDNLRMPGSIGSTAPQRVFKGLRMAGRMGGARVTVKHLTVVTVDRDKNELVVSGAVPGPRNGFVLITAGGEMPEAPNKPPEPTGQIKVEPTPKAADAK